MCTMDQEMAWEKPRSFLCVIPMFHAFGLAVVVYAQLQMGNAVVSMRNFETEMVLKVVEKCRVTHMWLVPLIILAVAPVKQRFGGKYDLSLKLIGSAAAPLGKELMEVCSRNFPHVTVCQWYEMNSKSLEIFVEGWFPEPGVETKGVLCFCHGYGDTCTFFFEGIARQLAARGYGVYALDHTGFGLSDGLHGYISSFDGLVDTVNEQHAKIKGKAEIKGLPCFLLGQSMGGAVALKALLKEPNAWDGIILVAPMCRVAEDLNPPAPVLKALMCLSNFLPKAKLVPQKDLAELAYRCVKKRKMAEYNVICYNDQLRLRTAVELLKATDEIEAQVEKVSSPLLILHGAADKVTDPLISQFLYEKSSSKDKTLKLYEGGYQLGPTSKPSNLPGFC